MILIGAISILNISIEIVLEKSYRPGFSEQLHALLAEMRASSRREIALEMVDGFFHKIKDSWSISVHA
jgi:hypothetical protein